MDEELSESEEDELFDDELLKEKVVRVAEQKNVASLHTDLVFELQNILRHVRMKNLKP